jgi:hypothetical protein
LDFAVIEPGSDLAHRVADESFRRSFDPHKKTVGG